MLVYSCGCPSLRRAVTTCGDVAGCIAEQGDIAGLPGQPDTPTRTDAGWWVLYEETGGDQH